MLNYLIVDEIIKLSLKEDMPFGDCTTEATISSTAIGKVDLICKDTGILCGIEVFKRVFSLLGNVDFEIYFKDGDAISPNDLIATLSGNVHSILMGERVALNLLQRMSGIATNTRAYVDIIKNYKSKLLDTRKTTPMLRHLEKYSVTIGGATNHRYCLSDGILIKDNHISLVGGIKEAVKLAKESSPFVRKIEVETESKEDVLAALESGADIIMLDNMTPEQVTEMINLINGKSLIECSGNINLDTIEDYAKTGVDFISSGSIIYSANPLDFSLKNLKPLY